MNITGFGSQLIWEDYSFKTIDLADAFYSLNGIPTTDNTVCGYFDDGSADLWTLNEVRYANRDPLLRATLFIPGMAWGEKGWYYGGAAASYSTLYVMKYFNPALNWSTSWDSGQDFYVIRYAEVLLSLAEAYIEKNEGLDRAVFMINSVRERVGMPSVEEVEGADLSQAALRDIVRHERQVELAFEGLRLFDLYRWGLLKDAVDRINNEATTFNFWYEYRNYRGEQEYFWPIPQTEIDSNSQLEQNSLWK
ncbi:RagB/SusD family nutrient uptake outer membrane protein [Geofilum sp. OHC36d9]|uniref:RagB/SusD family nutrient uptake outer membrane protein n=1 Tax=Geofilum sp. OHC36d9 TaxID=3458413 RepID=UPI0040345572